jgi:hypothetical protein
MNTHISLYTSILTHLTLWFVGPIITVQTIIRLSEKPNTPLSASLQSHLDSIPIGPFLIFDIYDKILLTREYKEYHFCVGIRKLDGVRIYYNIHMSKFDYKWLFFFFSFIFIIFGIKEVEKVLWIYFVKKSPSKYFWFSVFAFFDIKIKKVIVHERKSFLNFFK